MGARHCHDAFNLERGTTYHVQSTAEVFSSAFRTFPIMPQYPHCGRASGECPCQHGIYPFTDASLEDFEPVFEELIRISEDRTEIFYRPDDYAKPFLPVADSLVARAEDAEDQGDTARALNLYLRAAAVYRIARFPINRSEVSQEAWENGKDAYVKAGRYLNHPSVAVEIPFTCADVHAGDMNVPVQAYLRMPLGGKPEGGWPLLLFIRGLDAYRTDHTPRTQAHVDQGYATLSFEIPGTGDCPAAPNDPCSPDRVMSSVLDWVVEKSTAFNFDATRILARGISTGGYYAMRIAHTHADRLFAVVAQGGGCHYMFDPAWISAQNQMDYPFALADALAYKFGYRGADAVAAYSADATKFSLLSSGVLDKPSCKLLVINGTEDSIFPIEDSYVVAVRGSKKDLIARGSRGHMGNPGAEGLLYQWIDDALAGKL